MRYKVHGHCNRFHLANENFSQIQQILETGQGITHIQSGFPVEELTKPGNFLSLLFYFKPSGDKPPDPQKIKELKAEAEKQLKQQYCRDEKFQKAIGFHHAVTIRAVTWPEQYNKAFSQGNHPRCRLNGIS